MELNSREVWTVVHGLVLGTIFLMAFAGGLACDRRKTTTQSLDS